MHKTPFPNFVVGVGEANLPIKLSTLGSDPFVYALVSRRQGAAQVVPTSPTFLYTTRTPSEAVLAIRGFT